MKGVLIGTSDFFHRSWSDPGIFYPPDVKTAKEKLQYYSKKFNMLTISSTYENIPDTGMYEEFANIILEQKMPFSFIVTAPKNFTQSHSISSSIKEWSIFWNGYLGRGGCKILHEKGVLGCILLRFSSSFHFNTTHVNKILKITKMFPEDVKFSFLFLHCSWTENSEKILELFQQRSNWCICTPFVENRLVNFGWAGNIPSTRTFNAFREKENKMLLTTDFIHITLSGTLGPGLGSYDKDGFLEKFVDEIERLKNMGIKTIFCSFDANVARTTFCYPLPGVIISGFFLNPKIQELPGHTSVDRPCCLHDAFRFQELLAAVSEMKFRIEKDSPPKYSLGIKEGKRYKKDKEGFIEIKFK